MSQIISSTEQLEAEIAVDNEENKKYAPAGPQLPFFLNFLPMEDDAFFKQWAGPMLIGPFVIAILCIVIILTGQIMANTWTGTCGYPLDLFITLAIFVSYMFLIVYSWVFIGDSIEISSESLGVKITPLRPIKSMQFLMFLYIVTAVTSFIVWIIGSAILNLASFCVNTAPELYSYCLFLVVLYWVGFVIVLGYVIKQGFGDKIAGMVNDSISAPTNDEMESRIFRKKFNEFDPEKSGKMPSANLAQLLQGLGVYVPESEIPALKITLDPTDSEFIKFDTMWQWFQKMSETAEGNEKDGEDDSDED